MKEHAKSLDDRCAEYLLEEPEPALREQINSLRASIDGQQELENRMMQHLSFGTAGLRGRMEAGYNRMNQVSVYRFCFALGCEIDARVSAEKKCIVIGFDGRDNSASFATDSAKILAAMGFLVHLFESAVPTPLCAYAVKYLDAEVGIMITASHNPKYDNGIKVFQRTSAQTFGSILKRIENNMSRAPLRSTFFSEHQQGLQNAHPQKIGDEVFKSYLQDIKATQLFNNNEVERHIDVVYTPLHGVGKNYFMQAVGLEGFDKVMVVPDQAEPDGQFPTVIFPNPEENHTLDRAHQFAVENHIDWVFANDPDADRLQVSCRDSDGEYKKLSGNEMGAILGYFCIRKAKALGIKPMVASSIVSSRMLKAISEKLGAHYVDALTGFSNIVAKAVDLQATCAYQLVFAYEEAIGFLCGQVVLDKDGINAGARFMEIVGYLKKSGHTVWQLLEELYRSFGIFVNQQWSQRFDGVDAMMVMANVMTNARKLSPGKMAQMLGVSECQKYDLLDAQKNNCYEGMYGDVVIFEINTCFRLIIRPSGTEPKIKFYLELFLQATNPSNISGERLLLEHQAEELRSKIGLLLAI